ncbi:HNH endonuclease [Halorubrum aethiopicum]|uniref:HNH endonuclease n=1 Tax=Halorubrum aethiopicum TaxID=1758255 RepID=UPI0009B5BC56
MTAFDLKEALEASDSHSVPHGSSSQAAAPGSSSTDRRAVSTTQREQILQRDNHECQNCKRSSGSNDIDLEVHHIVPKAMNGTDHSSNLVTLCHQCHKAAHGWSG